MACCNKTEEEEGETVNLVVQAVVAVVVAVLAYTLGRFGRLTDLRLDTLQRAAIARGKVSSGIRECIHAAEGVRIQAANPPPPGARNAAYELERAIETLSAHIIEADSLSDIIGVLFSKPTTLLWRNWFEPLLDMRDAFAEGRGFLKDKGQEVLDAWEKFFDAAAKECAFHRFMKARQVIDSARRFYVERCVTPEERV